MTRLAILCLLLVGCGEGSHNGPIVRDHGWEDGVYVVKYDGKTGYITVEDGKFSLGDEPVAAKWVETRTRGATAVGGWWYQGSWRGYLVGIRGGYQFRIVHIVVTAQPVKGDG